MKTPYECMKLNKNLDTIIKNDTYSLDNSSIINFSTLKGDVYSEVICAEKNSGVKVSLKGLRIIYNN